MITVDRVMVLGVPAGNLWAIKVDQFPIAQCTYHGDSLVLIKTTETWNTLKRFSISKSDIEILIDELYVDCE